MNLPGRRPGAAIAVRLGASGRELAGLAAIVAAAAALRFVNLPLRGGWDSDQGTEMLALRAALSAGRLPTFGPEAISVSSSFHHGALYYDLLLPAAWLGNGDPTWVVAEIALISLVVIPIVWWIARSIAGPVAGLTAAFLAATSAALVGYATFIWNPTLVQPGAAIAFLGAWQALRSRRSAWWAVAAAGTAVAVQAHIAAAVLLLPMAVAFLIDLRRGPAWRRRGTVKWGLIGGLIFAATYLPVIVHELGNNFSETRGMLAYFSDPNSTSTVGPALRLIFAGIRLLAWPLTRWPMVDRSGGATVAFMVATAIIVGLTWRLGVTARGTTDPIERAATEARPSAEPSRSGTTAERFGVRLIGGWLLLLIVALGLGLHAVSEVQAEELPTEQYHVVVDPLVFIAAGLIAGGLWREIRGHRLTLIRRAATVVAVGSVVAWNMGHMPPSTSPDGGWPAAQAAATRLERDAAGSATALVPLFAEKGSDAYLYPLTRDGFALVAPTQATVVILLCDTYWLEVSCDTADAQWLSTNSWAAPTRLDRFTAATPYRVLTVYRRGT
ncbi:MAG TPA: glycosyltransferase family 39 protein [Candidatus Limnocylindrales bacterium]